VIIAQISDTHIAEKGRLLYERVDTARFLAQAVQHIRTMIPSPDVVLGTGDLVDAGRPEEYRHLRELLAPLPMPVYLIPGNHDDRQALVSQFPDHRYLPRSGFVQYVVEGYPVRLLALDTLIPGQGGGLVCAERLAWLESRLAEAPDRPTVIFMHHPPFPIGVRRMDALGLAGADALGEVVRRHPQVERVLCGHVHRAVQVRWAGTVASTAPSTAHQVWLDLRDDAERLGFTLEPPACQVHVWRPGTGLISHTSHTGTWDGPYAFRGGQKLDQAG
jgi:3',5'-cyclic AMP phosphodiesterase CpdA